MKDKLDKYGKRLPWDAEGKYVTLLSDKDILTCDSVPSDRQTCALRSHYEVEVAGSSETLPPE